MIREFFYALRYAITNPGGRRPGDPRVFVSYQRKSTLGWPVLFKREWKEKHRIAAFLDTEQVDAAEQITAKVAHAISDSDAFVCFLGQKTLSSKWVQAEIKLAWEKGKPMVPVFQQDFQWPAETENSRSMCKRC